MAKHMDLVIDQGSRYQLVISVTGITDMTGFSARGMIRKRATDTGSPIYDMTNKLTVDVANKQVKLDIDAVTTAAFTWSWGVYDIETYNTGDTTQVYRLLEGRVALSREVTR